MTHHERPEHRYGWADDYRWRHSEIQPSPHATYAAKVLEHVPAPALDYVEGEAKDALEYMVWEALSDSKMKRLSTQEVIDAIGYLCIDIGPRLGIGPYNADNVYGRDLRDVADAVQMEVTYG